MHVLQQKPAHEHVKHFKINQTMIKWSFLRIKDYALDACKRDISKNCQKRLLCNTCKQNHPTILHIQTKGNQRESQTETRASTSTTSSNAVLSLATGSNTGARKKECALAIVPVKVKLDKGTKCVESYAFLDPGSSATFCTEELAKQLAAPGRKMEIILKTMGQEKTLSTYRVSGLEVAALDSENFLKLPDVFTQKQIPVTHDDIPKLKDIRKWPYLKEVDVTPISAGIGLLIGVNIPRALEPWKIINSVGSGPYAVKTLLGWVINGPLDVSMNGACTTVNRISIVNLENLLIKQYNEDFMEQHYGEQTELSQDDKQFLEIASDSAELKSGHYHLKLPFHNTSVNMPNNRQTAHQRAQNLVKRFKKGQAFFNEYKAFMNEVMAKGYAEVVPQSELQPKPGKLWYLPHHGVYHPHKHKLHVVFDCAAVYGGTSLNKELLQGPDLMNTLLGVLLCFHLGFVAFITDIEGMFHQVHVAKEHLDFLRFLWWPDGDISKDLIEHRMLVHIFWCSFLTQLCNILPCKKLQMTTSMNIQRTSQTPSGIISMSTTV